MTLEFISSPFGYLRHLRPKLLVGIRKQTNKRKSYQRNWLLGQESSPSWAVLQNAEPQLCHWVTFKGRDELGKYLHRGPGFGRTIHCACSVADYFLLLFLGKVKEKLQRADSVLIWRAEVCCQWMLEFIFKKEVNQRSKFTPCASSPRQQNDT